MCSPEEKVEQRCYLDLLPVGKAASCVCAVQIYRTHSWKKIHALSEEILSSAATVGDGTHSSKSNS